MYLKMLKSKLHMAVVTGTNLNYHGSITIPRDLLDLADLREHEAVVVANVASGQRGETYIIEGPRGSDAVELNGAIARMAEPGDRVIVLAFADMTPEEADTHEPTIVLLDANNQPEEVL